MIFDMTTYTFVHVVVSLVGIVSGLVVLVGLLTAKRLGTWTAVFLATTAATSVTGFGFPFFRFLPSHAVGIVSLAVLVPATFGLYARRLVGPWRWIYVVGAVLALYLNIFVLIVQLFRRVPALSTLAPTQTEPPFVFTQVVVMVLFVALGIAAAKRFRPEPAGAAQWSQGPA